VGSTGATGATGGSSASNAIIYQPGGVTSGQVYATWAGVQGVIAATQVPLTVYVDDSIVTPAPIPVGVTNCRGLVTISPLKNNAGSPTTVSIANGGVLQDLAGISGVIVIQGDASGSSPLLFTISGQAFILSEEAALELLAGATVPFFSVTSVLALITFEGPKMASASAEPVISVGGGAQLQWIANSGLTLSGTNVVTGSGTINFNYDSTVPLPNFASYGFTGTINTQNSSDNSGGLNQRRSLLVTAAFNVPVPGPLPSGGNVSTVGGSTTISFSVAQAAGLPVGSIILVAGGSFVPLELASAVPPGGNTGIITAGAPTSITGAGTYLSPSQAALTLAALTDLPTPGWTINVSGVLAVTNTVAALREVEIYVAGADQHAQGQASLFDLSAAEQNLRRLIPFDIDLQTSTPPIAQSYTPLVFVFCQVGSTGDVTMSTAGPSFAAAELVGPV
jgi:hypothetical protein